MFTDEKSIRLFFENYNPVQERQVRDELIQNFPEYYSWNESFPNGEIKILNLSGYSSCTLTQETTRINAV